MTDSQSKDQKLWKVSWRDKRTGIEHFEDFIRAPDFEGAIRETKRQIARAENGVAVVDIEITDIGEREGRV